MAEDNNNLPIKQDSNVPMVQDPGVIMESVLAAGDLSKLSPRQRCEYYNALCNSLKLNPFSKPFEYIELDDGRGNKKLTLYATRGATDQMRTVHHITFIKIEREIMDDLFIVRVTAKTMDGRIDEAEGCLPLTKEKGEWKSTAQGKRYWAGTGEYEKLKGQPLADIRHKAETKAKRRVTLSILGLGWVVEDEKVGTYSQRVDVNLHTGELEGKAAPPFCPNETVLMDNKEAAADQLFGPPKKEGTKHSKDKEAKARWLATKVEFVQGGALVPSFSEPEKIYKVVRDAGGLACPCEGYVRNVQRDAGYQCAHILAVNTAITAWKERKSVRTYPTDTPKTADLSSEATISCDSCHTEIGDSQGYPVFCADGTTIFCCQDCGPKMAAEEAAKMMEGNEDDFVELPEEEDPDRD